MIKAQPISWFYENLPELQIIEDKFKDIIRKNYNLSGFVSLDTPAVERLEILTSKWADDSEIYALHRIHAENLSDVSMWLRFDLTVPLARYIGQYEWELTFPFKRQQIGRVYRWERPQKWRYREFYQADVDIIWNGKLALFADVEILSTIYSSLKELDFWDFVIHVNNKKFLSWFLLSIWIWEDKLVETISIIDKKEKIKWDKLQIMFTDIGINKEQIDKINEFVDLWKQKTIDEITSDFSDINNELLQEWIKELSYVYKNLLLLWIDEKFLKINPAISRGLNYYTGTVFETFIGWAEWMWSIASGWRYENLASNFTKNNFPGVGGSIWLSRLLSVLAELDKIRPETKTVSQVLIVNMWDEFLTNNLQIVKNLRKMLISTELYLDPEAKIQKQLKYANNKGIPFIIIAWEEEINNWIIQIKNLKTWEQYEIKMEKLNYNLFF